MNLRYTRQARADLRNPMFESKDSETMCCIKNTP